MNNKKVIIALFSLSFLFIISGVLAYFYNNSSIQNRFVSGTYKTVSTEQFVSPTNWLPGDETVKTITTKNEGTVPVRVRVKIDDYWMDKNNNRIDNKYCVEESGSSCINSVSATIINFDNTSDWIFSDIDNYFYYVGELQSGEETSSFIKSVTFNPLVGTIIDSNSQLNNFNKFQGATYNLNFTIETVQADKCEELWEYVPAMYDYVGDNPCTYDGELVQGAEFVSGQYTYRYRQAYIIDVTQEGWENIPDLGWGVKLTNPDSTDPVTSTLCSSINNKPIVSTASMFANSKTTSVDMSSFDTSNVIYMNGMFYNSELNSIDMASLNTSKVKSMDLMFFSTEISNLDFSHNDISSLISLYCMFEYSNIDTLNLSTLEYKDNMFLYGIFRQSNIGRIIVRDQTIADLGHSAFPCTDYYIGEELVYPKDSDSCNSSN